MDIFKYNTSGPNATKLQNGEIINGITEVMWVERYREPGEFTIKAPVYTDIRTTLAIGTYISHIDTLEVMVVENHEISETADNTIPEVIITGRSFEVITENRVVGAELVRTSPPSEQLAEYSLTAAYTWIQAMELLSDHIVSPLTDDDNEFVNVEPMYIIGDLSVPFDYVEGDPSYYATVTLPEAGSFFGEATRVIPRGTVHERLLDILKVDDFGIKIVRPGQWAMPGPWPFPGVWTATIDGPVTGLVIHNGKNRSHVVVFSYANGEVEAADYLWSNKRRKTHAIVSGKWVEVRVDDPLELIKNDRRIMHVDASFIDDYFDTPPTGGDLLDVIGYMETYGAQMLLAQRDVSLIKVEIAKNTTRNQYRRDYNIGDIVRVEGNYDTVAIARVIEYVELDNEQGEDGYPTLAIL